MRKNYDLSTIHHFDGYTINDSETHYPNAPVFCDCALVAAKETASDSWTYDLFDPITVTALVDGKLHREVTAEGGIVLLDYEASFAVIGLPFDATIETLRLDAGAVLGSSQGSIKRIHEVDIAFYKTIGAQIGPNSSTLEEIIFREATVNMDDPTPMFTGQKNVVFNGDYERDGRIYINNPYPLPMTILSITAKGVTHEG
jgi:hypothetical protein